VKTGTRTDQLLKCPVCGNDTGIEVLTKLGISHEEIHFIEQYVKSGTFKDVLRIAEVAMRRLDPDKTGLELHVNNAIARLKESAGEISEKFMTAQKQLVEELSKTEEKEKANIIKEYEEKQISTLKEFQREITERTKTVEQLEKERLRELGELKQSINDMREKIIGTGIGDVGEMVTLLDLKKAIPSDSFSETRAAKHGTDIVATVKDKGRTCGTITISVKYQQSWSGEFLSQLGKNMTEDGTRWGILVTKSFPREALSTKAWVTEDDAGNTVILVKPEYAPLAYIGLRQAVIHWFDAKQMLNCREAEVTEAEKIMAALSDWINGEQFQDSIHLLDKIQKEAEKTRTNLHQIQNYVNTKLTDAAKCQDGIIENVIHTKALVGRLRELLDSSPSATTSESNNAYNAYNEAYRISKRVPPGGSA